MQPLANGKGVQERLKDKLIRMIQNMPPTEVDKLTIKLTGDGTCVGSRLHVTHFGFVVITDKWRTDDSILAIAKVPEKYDAILEVLKDLIMDTQTLQSVNVNGKTFRLQYVQI